MLRRFVIVLLFAACGRLNFDDIVGGGDGGGSDDMPRLVVTGGAGNTTLDDVALTDAGELLMVGGFTGTLELGGLAATSTASMNDLFAAAIEPDDNARWLWGAGASVIGNAQGIEWIGGGAVSGGYFAGTLANGSGITANSGQDALLTWFGADGQVVAAQQFGASRNVQIRGLARGDSTIAITGTYADTVDFGLGALASAGTNDNAFIAAFDVNTRGARYSYSWNGNGDVYGNDIAVGADGSVCVVGRFMAPVDFGGGVMTPSSNDAFVVRYDAQGSFVWARRSGGPGSESGAYVTVLDNGDCVAGGFYQTAFSWDGEPLAFAGTQDAFVARFAAADGAIRWLHTFGGPGYENVFGLASSGNDRIALGGAFEMTARLVDRDVTSDGDADAFVFVLDGEGTPLAFHHLGGAGKADGSNGGVAFDPSGTHVAAGLTITGELDVAGLGLAATSTGTDGAALIVPVP